MIAWLSSLNMNRLGEPISFGSSILESANPNHKKHKKHRKHPKNLALNYSSIDEQLGVEDSGSGGAADGVVAQGNEAIIEYVIGKHAAD